jgi:hypothetical protein
MSVAGGITLIVMMEAAKTDGVIAEPISALACCMQATQKSQPLEIVTVTVALPLPGEGCLQRRHHNSAGHARQAA